jgi:PAS domain S-box-containing protein
MKNITPAYTLGSETKLLLREQAERLLQDKVALSAQNLDSMSPAAVRALAHELQVHQIELEMQNEELRKTQLQLQAERERYFDLYDLAPVSYCTVSEAGVITEANLATAELLDVARSKLVGQQFSRYIKKEYQDTFYLCRKLLLANGAQRGCELQLTKADGSAVWVHVNMTTAIDSQDKTVQRLVLTDITAGKTLAIAMQQSEARLRTLIYDIP